VKGAALPYLVPEDDPEVPQWFQRLFHWWCRQRCRVRGHDLRSELPTVCYRCLEVFEDAA
jgi:hypothetical protein